MSAFSVLRENGITSSSRIVAVQQAGAVDFSDPTQYNEVLTEMGGIDVDIPDDYAKHTFMYVVDGLMVDPSAKINDLLKIAEQKAIKYVTKNPWVLVKPEHTNNYVPKKTTDAMGNPKKKKGAKKAAAIKFWKDNQGKYTTRKDWIDALIKHIGLSPAGASTYHYNLKKGIYK